MDPAAVGAAGDASTPELFADYGSGPHTVTPNVNYAGLVPLAWAIGLNAFFGVSFLLAFGALRQSTSFALKCYAPKLVLDEELQERGGRGEAPDGRISPPDLEVPTFSSNRHTRPPLTRLPVAWLRPLMALDEEAVVQYSGLDAAVLLRVFDMGTRLFGVLSLLLPPTLIPVFWTAHAGASGMNANARVNWDVAVSLSNVASGSRRLWVPLAAAYVVTFYTLALLRRQYKEIAALRLRELCSDRASAEAYAVLCLDIPSLAQAERDAEEMACPGGSDEDADADADADDPPPPALTARPGRGGAARARAVLRRFARAAGNALFRAMTAIAFGYTVAPDGGARPATVEAYLSRIYPGVPMRAVMVPPLHAPKRAFKVWKMAEAAAAADAPPQHAGGDGAGPLGEELLGEDRRTAAVHASHRALLRAQAAAAAEPSHAAFVLFGRRADAAAAARTLLHSNPLHWQLRPAPGPGEVYWEALRLRWWERRVRGMLAAATAVLIALFFLAPVTAISSLSTLERVATWVPPLQRALRHPAARGFLEGYLPGLALAAALTAVQAVFVLLARREGALCASDEDRAVASRLFIVLLIDVFLGGTVARVLVSLLLQLSQLDWDFSLQTVLTLLGSNVPATWPLFVTFIAVRAGSGLPLELSRLPVVAAGAIRAAAGRAPRWRPGRLPYGTQVPNILLIFLVGLVYSTIAPVTMPFTLFFFAMGRIVWRYQVLFVYERVYETNGAWWPHVARRILLSLIVSHVTLAGVFALKLAGARRLGTSSLALWAGPALVPLPFCVIMCYRHFERRYGPLFYHLPLSAAADLDREGAPGLAFAGAYTAPAMRLPPPPGALRDLFRARRNGSEPGLMMSSERSSSAVLTSLVESRVSALRGGGPRRGGGGNRGSGGHSARSEGEGSDTSAAAD